jgi:hypothetical protein
VSAYVYVHVCLSVYVHTHLYAYVYDLFSNTLVERELMPRVAISLKTLTNDSARDCSPNRIVYACICVYVFVSVSRMCICICLCLCLCMRVFVCMCMCIYMDERLLIKRSLPATPLAIEVSRVTKRVSGDKKSIK